MIREEKAKNNQLAQIRSLMNTSFGAAGFRHAVERRELALGRLGRPLFFQSPRLLGGAAQEELDLRIEAAQIVVRPALDGVQHRWVDAKEERLAIGHDGLLIDGSRVDHRLGIAVPAQHYQQVRHHRGDFRRRAGLEQIGDDRFRMAPGFGVQFVDLNEEQTENLSRLLKIAREAGPEAPAITADLVED